MAGARYRQFVRLCQEWPIDKTKSGRDLGAYIREQVAANFRKGEASVVDEAECARVHESLSRICSNTYQQRYPRAKGTQNASGLSKEELQTVLSTEGLQSLWEDDRSFLSRMRDRIIPSKE